MLSNLVLPGLLLRVIPPTFVHHVFLESGDRVALVSPLIHFLLSPEKLA